MDPSCHYHRKFLGLFRLRCVRRISTSALTLRCLFASSFALLFTHSHSLRVSCFRIYAAFSLQRSLGVSRIGARSALSLRTFDFALCFRDDAEPTERLARLPVRTSRTLSLTRPPLSRPPPRFRTLTSSASLPLACPDNCTAQVDLGTPLQYFALLP